MAVGAGGTRDAVGEALGEGVMDGIAEGVVVAWSDGEHAQSPKRSGRKRKRRRRIIVDIPCLTGNQPSHYTRTSSGCSAGGSALALGARGPGFKSRHPDLFYVYILHSQISRRYYVGSTQDVEKRLREHNAGKSLSTRFGIPWKLIHTESFSIRSEAIVKERKIKARGIARYLSGIQNKSSR